MIKIIFLADTLPIYLDIVFGLKRNFIMTRGVARDNELICY